MPRELEGSLLLDAQTFRLQAQPSDQPTETWIWENPNGNTPVTIPYDIRLLAVYQVGSAATRCWFAKSDITTLTGGLHINEFIFMAATSALQSLVECNLELKAGESLYWRQTAAVAAVVMIVSRVIV